MKEQIKYTILITAFGVFLLAALNQYYVITQNRSLYSVFIHQDTFTNEELEWLYAHEELRFGDTIDSFPAQINQNESVQYQGYSIDIMNMLSIEMETPITFVPLDWADTFSALENKEIDFFNLTYSEERKQRYLLSEPLYQSRGIVFMSDGEEKYDDLDKLDGSKIAVTKEDYIIKRLYEKCPNVDILIFDRLSECMDALLSGKADGVAGDEQNIMYYAQERALFGNFYVIQEPVYIENAVMAIRKSDPELLGIMNKAIRSFKRKGISDKIQQKWFLSSILIDDTDRKVHMLVFVTLGGIILFVFILFMIINKELKRLVKKRTQDLTISKRTLESTLNAIPYFLIEFDLRGNILYANKKALIELKLSMKEIKNTENALLFKQLYHIDYQNVFQNVFVEVFENKYYLQKEAVIQNHIYSITCGQVSPDRYMPQAILILEDITKNKLNEKQVLQSSKMAAVGQLAAGISHEIRNPLGLVRNYCYALKNGFVNQKEQMLEMVQSIEEAVDSANKMVENLLNFSRITPKEIFMIDMYELILSILKLQNKSIHSQGIKTVFRCPQGLFIKGNPEGMKHIIINFITNAADAMPNGGILQIRCFRQKGQAVLYFVDNGSGIEKENIEHIFNPFFTSKPVGAGTGLGLYIAYNLIQEYNGSVSVFSKPFKGTIFRLSFPEEA